MTTVQPQPPHVPLVVGQTVHYRDRSRCWAAAIVERGPDDTAQLFVFPLPPSFPMPANPGTFVDHDGGTTDETWHRLDECGEIVSARPVSPTPRRRRRRRQPDSD